MKHRALILFVFFCGAGMAQMQDYFSATRQAEHFLDAGEYLNAAAAYNQAFRKNGDKAQVRDRYNAACAWARAKYPDSAFVQLKKLLPKSHVIGYDHIASDQDLFPLQMDPRWKPLLDSVKYHQALAEKKMNVPLARRLESILDSDQEDRKKIVDLEKSAGPGSEEIARLWKDLRETDSLNLGAVTHILDSCGWLGREVVGEKGNMALFLVIQHADLKTQEKYLPMMREAVSREQAEPSALALLEDRVAVDQGKKQIYGSQVMRDEKTGNNVFFPIEDEAHVNERRASVGLGPIEEYARNFGITYPAHEEQTAIAPAQHKVYPGWLAALILGFTGLIVFLFFSRYFRR